MQTFPLPTLSYNIMSYNGSWLVVQIVRHIIMLPKNLCNPNSKIPLSFVKLPIPLDHTNLSGILPIYRSFVPAWPSLFTKFAGFSYFTCFFATLTPMP